MVRIFSSCRAKSSRSGFDWACLRSLLQNLHCCFHYVQTFRQASTANQPERTQSYCYDIESWKVISQFDLPCNEFYKSSDTEWFFSFLLFYCYSKLHAPLYNGCESGFAHIPPQTTLRCLLLLMLSLMLHLYSFFFIFITWWMASMNFCRHKIVDCVLLPSRTKVLILYIITLCVCVGMLTELKPHYPCSILSEYLSSWQ